MAAVTTWKLSNICYNVVYTSSATVGATKTLTPERFLPGGVALYSDQSVDPALGRVRATLSQRPPTKDSRLFKTQYKLFVPTLETIDPAVGIFGPKLAYECQAHLDVLIPERATSAEKTAFYSYLLSSIVDTINASDGSPADTTLSPVPAAVVLGQDVW